MPKSRHGGSLRAAVDAMCKKCIYDPIAGKGTWRQQVDACTAHDCPLYPVRPTPSAALGDSTEDAADLTGPLTELMNPVESEVPVLPIE